MSIDKVDFEITATREIGYREANVTITLTSSLPNGKCVNALLDSIMESEIGVGYALLNDMSKNPFGYSIVGTMENVKMSKLAQITEIVAKVMTTEMRRINFDFPALNVTLSGTAEI